MPFFEPLDTLDESDLLAVDLDEHLREGVGLDPDGAAVERPHPFDAVRRCGATEGEDGGEDD
jgi:hypothetical protein